MSRVKRCDFQSKVKKDWNKNMWSFISGKYYRDVKDYLENDR